MEYIERSPDPHTKQTERGTRYSCISIRSCGECPFFFIVGPVLLATCRMCGRLVTGKEAARMSNDHAVPVWCPLRGQGLEVALAIDAETL